MNTLTITDAGPGRAATPRRLPIRGMAAALIVWFGGVASLTVALDPPNLVVFGPERMRFDAVAATGASLLSAGRGFVTIRAERPGTVRALYAHGAWFVWPAMRAGCAG